MFIPSTTMPIFEPIPNVLQPRCFLVASIHRAYQALPAPRLNMKVIAHSSLSYPHPLP